MRSVVAIFTRANAAIRKIATETWRFNVTAVLIEFGQFVHEYLAICIYKNENSAASFGTAELISTHQSAWLRYRSEDDPRRYDSYARPSVEWFIVN